MANKKEQQANQAQAQQSHIPTFKTIEEEAEFWDTHSIEEFADELEPVTDVQFVPARQKKALTVQLEEDRFEALNREASERGVDAATLVHILLLEHLQNREQKGQTGG